MIWLLHTTDEISDDAVQKDQNKLLKTLFGPPSRCYGRFRFIKQFVQQRLVADIEQTVTVMDSPEGKFQGHKKVTIMVPVKQKQQDQPVLDR